MAKPSHIETGGQVVALPASVDELLKRVHARRKLPPADERRRIREAVGLSLRDVGAALGVSHTAVSDWEAGAMPRERQRATYALLLDELRRLA
jgi:DNA-binding transcriptional regulator YiaG